MLRCRTGGVQGVPFELGRSYPLERTVAPLMRSGMHGHEARYGQAGRRQGGLRDANSVA